MKGVFSIKSESMRNSKTGYNKDSRESCDIGDSINISNSIKRDVRTSSQYLSLFKKFSFAGVINPKHKLNNGN